MDFLPTPPSPPIPGRPRVAIVPAAGLGTRLRPLTDLLPKEMLPVGRRFALEHIVTELAAAGIQRIVFVLSPAKEAFVRSRFTSSADVEFVFALQPEMRGLGDAILHAQPHVPADAPFVVALGDAVFEEPVPGALTRRVIDASTGASVAIAVQRVPAERLSRYGVVKPLVAPVSPPAPSGANVPTHAAWVPDLVAASPRSSSNQGLSTLALQDQPSPPFPAEPEKEAMAGPTRSSGTLAPAAQAAPPEGAGGANDAFAIDDIVEKPPLGQAPSEWAVAARYVVTPDVFPALRESRPGANGEVNLTDALHVLLARSPGFAVPLGSGEVRHDIGGWDSYYRAFLVFALADPEVGAGLRAFLTERLGGVEPGLVRKDVMVE
jgi:UTP--glucose-1-phosphate uridylyltransferase